MSGDVEHEQDAQRFVLRDGDAEAEMTYRLRDRLMIIDHTGVPEVLQHQGLANRLAEAALHFAREGGWTVVPECRFMAVYLKRHPEHAALTEERG